MEVDPSDAQSRRLPPPDPGVGENVNHGAVADDPGYGLEHAEPITSGSLAARRMLHRRV